MNHASFIQAILSARGLPDELLSRLIVASASMTPADREKMLRVVEKNHDKFLLHLKREILSLTKEVRKVSKDIRTLNEATSRSKELLPSF